MYDKNLDKVKFKPVVVTAKKLDTTPQGEDILRIEVPFEDDSKTIRDSIDSTDNDNKRKADNKEINKVTKEKIDIKEGNEMDERDVDKLLSEKIIKMKYQEKFDKLSNKAEDISTKTADIESKVDKLSDEVHESEDKISKGFIETCNGVDCIKKDMSELSNKINNLDLDKKFSEIDNKLSEFASKIEKIDSKEEEVLCTNCNSGIKVGSSYCPGCGAEIEGWEGLDNWKNYTKRSKK